MEARGEAWVEVWVEPFATIVDAVPLVNDEFIRLLIGNMFQMIGVASVELSR